MLMTRPVPKPIPPLVPWLGYGGLIPFVTLSMAVFLDGARATFWERALVGYGALILAFVGALHWGFAMTLTELPEPDREGRFLWSVVPALLAWPALLLPSRTGALLLVAGFLLHFAQDRMLAATVSLPGWYLPLRIRLTAIACLALLAPVFAGP
jgi:hypothetical protein